MTVQINPQVTVQELYSFNSIILAKEKLKFNFLIFSDNTQSLELIFSYEKLSGK